MITRKGLFAACRIFFLVALLGSNVTYAEISPDKSKSVDEYLSKLPAEFKLEENGPQKYCITSQLNNRDISGSTINRILITAEFTRRLDDGYIRWNNVRIGGSEDPAKPMSESMLRDYEHMEGFSYKISEDIMKEEFYKDFPADEVRNLVKALVWDEVMIEPFLWTNLDKLELNEFYRASDFEDLTVQMGDLGTIRMKDLRMRWTGISKMNEKLCALIHYKSFANPVVIDTGDMSINGRSLYWGSLWVSLEDKQIEYATLNEDVMMEMIFTGDSEKQLMDMQREVVFEKMQ